MKTNTVLQLFYILSSFFTWQMLQRYFFNTGNYYNFFHFIIYYVLVVMLHNRSHFGHLGLPLITGF